MLHVASVAISLNWIMGENPVAGHVDTIFMKMDLVPIVENTKIVRVVIVIISEVVIF